MKCKVCSNEGSNESLRLREMMFGYRDEFEYLECSSCKCVQIVDIPSSMSKYYPDSYHSFAPIGPRNAIRKAIVRRRNSYGVTGRGFIGRILSRFFPPDVALKSLSPLQLDRNARILDVGCGSGLLLTMLGDLGFQSLLGVDPFLAADIRYENGVKLLKRTIHEVAGEFDLIMFHHSFEHLSDPAPTLRAVQRLLAPDGDCIIRIPTVSSYAWKHYGRNWVQLDAPRHFFVHSVDSLRILADRAGMEISKVLYDSSAFQFWGSEQYALDIPLYDARSYLVSPASSSFSKDQIAGFERRAAELNRDELGDQAVFYLRKPSASR